MKGDAIMDSNNPDSIVSSVQSAMRHQEEQMQPIWEELAEQNQKRDDAILNTSETICEIQKDLQQTRQQMASQYAEYNKNREADMLQIGKDKKQSFRHDFYVAAFSVAFTLFAENFQSIVSFCQDFIGYILSFF